MVIAPYDVNAEDLQNMRKGGFDPRKDAVIKIDLMSVAKKLNDKVDMSEHEFR
jgi:hypothetical protein